MRIFVKVIFFCFFSVDSHAQTQPTCKYLESNQEFLQSTILFNKLSNFDKSIDNEYKSGDFKYRFEIDSQYEFYLSKKNLVEIKSTDREDGLEVDFIYIDKTVLLGKVSFDEFESGETKSKIERNEILKEMDVFDMIVHSLESDKEIEFCALPEETVFSHLMAVQVPGVIDFDSKIYLINSNTLLIETKSAGQEEIMTFIYRNSRNSLLYKVENKGISK